MRTVCHGSKLTSVNLGSRCDGRKERVWPLWADARRWALRYAGQSSLMVVPADPQSALYESVNPPFFNCPRPLVRKLVIDHSWSFRQNSDTSQVSTRPLFWFHAYERSSSSKLRSRSHNETIYSCPAMHSGHNKTLAITSQSAVGRRYSTIKWPTYVDYQHRKQDGILVP